MAHSPARFGSPGSAVAETKKKLYLLETRSFYLDKKTIKKLDSIAKRKNVSVNSLVNDVLINYANITYSLENYGYIIIAKAAMKDLLEKLPDAEILDAGSKYGLIGSLFWFDQLGRRRNLESVEELMKSFSDYGKYGPYTEEEVNGKKIITINHVMGIKFSIYVKSYIEKILSLITDRGDRYKKIEAFDKCVIFYE